MQWWKGWKQVRRKPRRQIRRTAMGQVHRMRSDNYSRRRPAAPTSPLISPMIVRYRSPDIDVALSHLVISRNKRVGEYGWRAVGSYSARPVVGSRASHVSLLSRGRQ
ncbi:hypothetical protein BIW11_02637 [Tropilaelaps mercedesae]|uniref:Uncharacterized protein n=1 Tax=Tropilaelaps mercedesae TaxID=418985 RepID=A0A1V9XZP0_9ACAR|nr:hypothetical protein BIW11_02637 [Tropilaelaps mercedesae]